MKKGKKRIPSKDNVIIITKLFVKFLTDGLVIIMSISIETEKVVFPIGDTTKIAEIEKFLQEKNKIIHVCVDDKKFSLSKRDIRRIEAEEPPKSVGGKMLSLVMDQMRAKEELLEEVLNFLKGDSVLSFETETFVSEKELGNLLHKYAEDWIAETEFSATTGRDFFPPE